MKYKAREIKIIKYLIQNESVMDVCDTFTEYEEQVRISYQCILDALNSMADDYKDLVEAIEQVMDKYQIKENPSNVDFNDYDLPAYVYKPLNNASYGKEDEYEDFDRDALEELLQCIETKLDEYVLDEEK